MGKKRRDPSLWTTKDVEADTEGYLAAQAAYQEDRAEQERAAAEDADRELYVREFVRQGGDREAGAAAWRKARDERAARTAEDAELEAERVSRRNVRSAL